MRLALIAGMLAGIVAAVSCTPARKTDEVTRLKTRAFGSTPSGGEVTLYTLANRHGMEADIMNYGGIVVNLKVPDRQGNIADVVLGYDSLDGYLKASPYFGALVGRYGNRIARGRFKLDGVEYTLARNNGENALHGGLKGFDKQLWTARDVSTATEPRLELTYVSRDGEEGYPGNLTAVVTYSVTEANELRIDYSATTDKDTVLNLTNHSYFNLAGQGSGDVLKHQVTIYADRVTPIDKGLIPTGELKPVAGTPFDFRQPHEIGERIAGKDEQLVYGKGYDHNFVLNGGGGSLAPAAKVYDASTGRVMEVLTDQPGLQFYTGNFLDGSITGKGGKVYQQRYAFCMETQHFPDSPNHPEFPSVELKPGERYHTTTVYRFSTAQ